ncbi:MAG: thioredoxin domain-containing protein [Pseudoxanthomonas sp.]
MSRLKPEVGPGDHAQGSREAPLMLVEYGDFQCPYCGEQYPEIKAVQEAMGDELCFVFRHFPLAEAHPHAEHAAELTEAADTVGKFWEMHDRLYEHQSALDDRSLAGHAQALGLDEALFQTVLDEEYEGRVRHDFLTGVRSGVNGTPSLFINGERYDGPRDADSLIKLLQAMRALQKQEGG